MAVKHYIYKINYIAFFITLLYNDGNKKIAFWPFFKYDTIIKV